MRNIKAFKVMMTMSINLTPGVGKLLSKGNCHVILEISDKAISLYVDTFL